MEPRTAQASSEIESTSPDMRTCHEIGDSLECTETGPLFSSLNLDCKQEQSCHEIVQSEVKDSQSYMKFNGNTEAERDSPVDQVEVGTCTGESASEYSSESETLTEEEYLQDRSQYLYGSDQDSLRKAVVDRTMDRFWVAFRRYFAPGTSECAGASPSSASEVPISPPVTDRQQVSRAAQHKRPRDHGEGKKHEDDDSDEEAPRPKKKTAASGESKVPIFACPFRKKNPRKYNITDHSSCAKTPRDINRLK